MTQQQAHLFIGFRLTPDLENQLQKSRTWKSALITWQSSGNGLQKVRYQNREYLGTYLSLPTFSLIDLRKEEESLRKIVKEHCPKFALDGGCIWIFPQLLVS